MIPAPTTPEFLRCFICLPLSEAIIGRVREAQRHFVNHLPRDGIQWTPPEQFHLTLYFLGRVPGEKLDALEDALRTLCRVAPPIRLALGRCGCFPGSHSPRVLWLGVIGELEPLMNLQREIASAVAAFGDHKESKPFSPHLTLGRVRPGSPVARALAGLIDSEFSPAAWTADELKLMRSDLGPHGALHTPLRQIPFGLGPASG